MTQGPIVVSTAQDNSDGIVVKFTKGDFSSFISSLMSTPREERFILQMGMDVSKSDIRVLVDKISHQIHTHTEVLGFELTSTVRYKGGRTRR